MVEIEPAGHLCGECEWTDDNGVFCRVLKAPLAWDNLDGPYRSQRCLDADAPELSPAEAVARDLGAQHG